MIVAAGRRRLQPAEILLQLAHIFPVIRRPELMGDGIEGDAMLGQQRLVLLEAIYEVSLLWFLLPPPGRLRWDDSTLDLGLDTVGAGLLLIAAYFSLFCGGSADESSGIIQKLPRGGVCKCATTGPPGGYGSSGEQGGSRE